MITVYDYSRAVVIGGRCKAKQVERDENGPLSIQTAEIQTLGLFTSSVTF